MPSNFPFNSGNTLPTALAAPVVVGITFSAAARLLHVRVAGNTGIFKCVGVGVRDADGAASNTGSGVVCQAGDRKNRRIATWYKILVEMKSME